LYVVLDWLQNVQLQDAGSCRILNCSQEKRIKRPKKHSHILECDSCLARETAIHVPLPTVILADRASACVIRVPRLVAVGEAYSVGINATSLDLNSPWELAGDTGSWAALVEVTNLVLVCIIHSRNLERVTVLGWVRLLVLDNMYATPAGGKAVTIFGGVAVELAACLSDLGDPAFPLLGASLINIVVSHVAINLLADMTRW
jgi:hypothetical protein